MSKNRNSKDKTETKPKCVVKIFTKSVLRNVDVPIKSAVSRYSVTKHPTAEERNAHKLNSVKQLKSASSNFEDCPAPESTCTTNRYTIPECNTILKLTQDLEKAYIQKPFKYKSTDQLTPRSKSTVLSKINKRLNFPTHKVLYKNLIPINVNNSLLLPKEREKVRKKYKSSGTADPVPDLKDFLDPVTTLSYEIPEPELVIEMTKLETNTFERLSRTYSDIYPNLQNKSTQILD